MRGRRVGGDSTRRRPGSDFRHSASWGAGTQAVTRLGLLSRVRYPRRRHQARAQGLDTARRTQFANDPLNLLAVDGGLNQQKGDGDAATWLPPNRLYRCPYVARQVAVKATYDLWMTQAEKNAIATVLSACPDEPLPAGVVVDLPEEEPEPEPVPVPVDPPDPDPVSAPAPAPAPAQLRSRSRSRSRSVYYPNCDAARAAGAAPLQAGEPGFRDALDRDGDGIACDA